MGILLVRTFEIRAPLAAETLRRSKTWSVAPLACLLLVGCVLPLAAGLQSGRAAGGRPESYDDCIRRAASYRASREAAAPAGFIEERRACAEAARR